MATTTNYGWTTPDDTALVKDGAAAIRTLGSSVDTTTKNLNPETTLGDLAYRSSTANVKTRLALGTANQVLAVNSGATAPEWKTLVSGGITLISETSASAISSLDLTSIPATYKDLVLTWDGLKHSDYATEFGLRFNADSGSNYKYNNLRFSGPNLGGTATMTTSAPTAGTSASPIPALGKNAGASNTEQAPMGSLTIYDYASTSKFKLYRLNFVYYVGSSGADEGQNDQSAVYASTSAISQINVVRLAGTGTFTNNANTSIRLYGVS
jgi:hypothetical protein